MAPVSVIPGRIRLESRQLIAKEGWCLFIENRLAETKGVTSVRTNPRTGRILVRFNEKETTDHELIAGIKDILDRMSSDFRGHGDQLTALTYAPDRARQHREASSALTDAVITIAGQVLIPKPLRGLVPIALRVLRGNL
ncbi:MAG: hypothetical protein A4E57_02203 [Syntrophorhabdaceae bacterium PtaU1.Bin034]|nr:MAG: hypothetical protein A4E57_02203 [Syntrophorhabdaceae bacterium PtaU1.Bin034]